MTKPTSVTSTALIARFSLIPHFEGGFYASSYRSPLNLQASSLTPRFPRGADRPCSTAIYYMLPRGSRSRLHRIRSDEMWHFYLGTPMRLIVFSEMDAREGDGGLYEMKVLILGQDVLQGQEVQYCVRAGDWFGAVPVCDHADVFEAVEYEGGATVDSVPAEEEAFSFVGCTVSPGFDKEDFELPTDKDAFLRRVRAEDRRIAELLL
ncbi:hypothetical protein HK101_000451 [Irineochytrium annulatum]|nr:hypothetical protein HK101_000451 [Irineochytrium annulatum]